MTSNLVSPWCKWSVCNAETVLSWCWNGRTKLEIILQLRISTLTRICIYLWWVWTSDLIGARFTLCIKPVLVSMRFETTFWKQSGSTCLDLAYRQFTKTYNLFTTKKMLPTWSFRRIPFLLALIQKPHEDMDRALGLLVSQGNFNPPETSVGQWDLKGMTMTPRRTHVTSSYSAKKLFRCHRLPACTWWKPACTYKPLLEWNSENRM